jgi:hypothetical protein
MMMRVKKMKRMMMMKMMRMTIPDSSEFGVWIL